MKRRDSLKYLLVGSIGATAIGTGTGCKTDNIGEGLSKVDGLYGRTPQEIEHDKKLNAEIFLNEHELATIAVLCDIILPATDTAGSATQAGVPEFIAFIVKDIPDLQLPLRGGLMWLNSESMKRFEKQFIDCTAEQEIEIIDDIAYPDPDNKKPLMAHGRKFFNQMRNLVLTGYYTSKMGFEDLGVNSNYANVWDGVPADVLADHDVDYDPEWLAKCVDQEKRMVTAEWDDQGNLIS